MTSQKFRQIGFEHMTLVVVLETNHCTVMRTLITARHQRESSKGHQALHGTNTVSFATSSVSG